MKKILYPLLALALFSCQEKGSEWADGNVDVVFSVSTPEPVDVQTRAYTDTDIETVDLLVFDQSSNFLERIKINTISGTGNNKTFTARLDASPNARTIHIVANGRTLTDVDRIDFSGLTPGVAASTAIPALTTTAMTTASEAQMMPLIMWGRVDVSTITSNTTVSNIKLLRSQAVIQVTKAAADATNGLADFEIASATLHSAASQGKVVPATYTSSATIPTTPNDAGGTRINYYTGSGYVVIGSTPLLYLYERANTASNYVALIIQGSWQGTSGFYKVILKNSQDVLLNVVRNHRYVVTVVKAYGAGYGTIAEAVANDASNIRVSITDNIDGLHFIQADGTGELGVSANTLKLWGTATNGSVDVATVLASRSSSLSATSSHTGLTSLSFSSAAGNGTRVLRATWTNSATQTGTITITDGLLTHTINVSTEPSLLSLSSTNDGNSYGFNLFTSAHIPWVAEVESGSDNVRLHPSSGAASAYAGGSAFGYSYLESRSFPAAFLHVTTTGGLAKVGVSYMESGSLKVGNIIINR